MYFDDEFIESLPDDPREAVLAACENYDYHASFAQDLDTKHELALEGHAFIGVFLKSRGISAGSITITGKAKDDVEAVNTWINDLIKSMKTKLSRSSYEDLTNIYSIKLGTAFHFEFSDGDLKQIQKLINELRDLISATDEIASDHKQRLLKKLEKFQSEFHKKVSDLDRFWGFFIDASIVVGIMGENAKPMVDVIQKIVKIIWPTQTRAYELSSDLPFKLLGQAEDDNVSENES
jgi:hypothetical protein